MSRRIRGLAVVVAVIVASCTATGSDTSSTVTSTTAAPIVTSTTLTPTTVSSGGSTVPPTTSTTSTTLPLADLSMQLADYDSGFSHPVLLVAAPDGGSDLVIEQPGRVVRADRGDHEVVLDITDDVIFDGEQGLLGFAVHPDFESNGLVYLSYTGSGRRSVIESAVLSDGVIDRTSRSVVMTIDQPAGNHNGGMIAFGPGGYLWIGLGDGGGADDTYGNGQNPDTALGSMLRVAVGPDIDSYGVPSDNPYVAGGGDPRIWAIGLRNPWRFAFDGTDLWIADVGQREIEEVNLVDTSTPGLNFGWNQMEGTSCFRSGCDPAAYILPVTEYGHDRGCSITGGVVYRGDAYPSLRGQFLYADYCTGLLRSTSADGLEFDWTSDVGVVGNITGFGTGSDGEAYVVTKQGGVYRVELS